MDRQPVSSTSIASVGYDAKTCVLEIAFQDGGVYRYYQVPQSMYRNLMSAESLGRFFIQWIRPNYSYSRIV